MSVNPIMASRPGKYNILIADDHKLYRQSVARIIQEIKNVKSVGEASNGKEALDMVKKGNWDLLLLDLEMPVLSGLDTMERLRFFPGNIPVIVVTMHKDVSVVKRVYDLGARGYLLKDSDIDELAFAIETVLTGSHYFTSVVSNMLLDRIKHEAAKSPQNRLTRQEIEVLKLICQQKTSKEIAMSLSIGVRTVESYRKQLMFKTGCVNMAGLSIYAIQHGYFTVKIEGKYS